MKQTKEEEVLKAELAKKAILLTMKQHNIRSIHSDNYGDTIITSDDFESICLFDDDE
jgi:hypothetical protein